MLNNILYKYKKERNSDDVFFFRNGDEAAKLRFQTLMSRHLN